MKKGLKTKNIILTVIFASIGALGGQYLVAGELQLLGIITTFVAVSITYGIMLLFSIRHKRKYGDIPTEDERSKLRGQRFILNTLILALYGSIILLTVLYYKFGIKSIGTDSLIIILMALLFFTGIGNLIAKRT